MSQHRCAQELHQTFTLMPTTVQTITSLPFELIDQIITSLGSGLPEPQTIRNIRLSSRLFNNRQEDWYKILIRRNKLDIKWQEVERKYKKSLLPSWKIYELFYRMQHNPYLSAFSEITWLCKTFPEQMQYDKNILWGAIAIGNFDLCRSLLKYYETQWIQDQDLIQQILNLAFPFDRQKIILHILEALDNAYRDTPQKEEIRLMLAQENYLQRAKYKAFINILRVLKDQWKLPLTVGNKGNLKGVLTYYHLLSYGKHVVKFNVQKDYEQLFQLYGVPKENQCYLLMLLPMIAEVEGGNLRYEEVELYVKAFGLSFKRADYSDYIAASILFGNPLTYKMEDGLFDYLFSQCSKEILEKLFLDKKTNNLKEVFQKISLSTQKNQEVNAYRNKIKEKFLKNITQRGSTESFFFLMNIAYRCNTEGSFQKDLSIVCNNLSIARSDDKKGLVLKLHHIIEHYGNDLTIEHRSQLIVLAKQVGDEDLIEALTENAMLHSSVVKILNCNH